MSYKQYFVELISIHSLRVEGDIVFPLLCRSVRYFNPLPPCGGRLITSVPYSIILQFQSTPSVWRETRLDSNPAPIWVFQSTPSVWRETASTRKFLTSEIFQSTPSVWRETFPSLYPLRCLIISIHSLRVEGDQVFKIRRFTTKHFNPLPPCGGRPKTSPADAQDIHFNPLPPCGGRRHNSLMFSSFFNFNPLPPCGGRPWDWGKRT